MHAFAYAFRKIMLAPYKINVFCIKKVKVNMFTFI